jgi:ferric-dicitrate binding protein FerR (iron transport regulator)
MKDIESLLILYFEGNLTDDEKRGVEDWINMSEDNYKLALQVQTIVMVSESIVVMKRIDVDKARKKVEGMIRREKIKNVSAYLQKIAAILIVPLFLFLLLEVYERKDSEIRNLEVKTNPGITTKLALSDGTIVHLNSESSLTYPEKFGKNERVVSLDGEAFFEVSKDPDRKFIVKTPHQSEIEVTGTSFNVEAFSEDSTISTTLISGSVSFVANNGVTNMRPGDKLVYNFNTNQRSISHTKGVSESSWKDGMIVFDDTPFCEALRILSKRFDVEFDVTNDKYKSYSLTGSFSNHRVEQILKIFSASSGIKWKLIQSDSCYVKNKIIIY